MDLLDKVICKNCVSEEYLNSAISNDGEIGSCSYCGVTEKIVSIEWLSNQVQRGVDENFHLTPSEPASYQWAMLKDKESNYDWDRYGQPVNDLIQDIVEVDEEVATDIQQYLSESNFDFDSMALSEEDPYGDDAHYEESPAFQDDAIASWNDLCCEIKSRSRFFSPKAETILDELFGGLNSFKTHDGTPVVKTITPDSKDATIYRARTAQSELEIEKILLSPVCELGAPISKYARAGRMNPAGISVFYGAENSDTCIAEIRPPVGSHVVIGEFKIIREIRLLDMDALTKLYYKGSYFNPTSKLEWGRTAFRRQIVNELIKPVLPGNEESEYLPTQIIAEYLSEKIAPKLDGIIFHSSQIAEKGKNIVLFNHASLTEPYMLPKGSHVSMGMNWSTPDDPDDSICVFEEVPDNLHDKNEVNEAIFEPADLLSSITEVDGMPWIEDRPVTLVLDINRIAVNKVKGATYSRQHRETSRQRVTNQYNSKPD